MIEANIEAKGEQEWCAWIATTCARLGGDDLREDALTLALERQLARQAVSGLLGIDPYEADPRAYESAVYAASLATRACWAKRRVAKQPPGLTDRRTSENL
jgi:hypothetical protein